MAISFWDDKLCEKKDALVNKGKLTYGEALKEAEHIIANAIHIIKHDWPISYDFLNLLKPEAFPEKLCKDVKWGAIHTNWKKLYYNPISVVVIEREKGIGDIVFQIMHILMHGMRGDFETTDTRDKLQNACIDYQVDRLLHDLDISCNRASIISASGKVEYTVRSEGYSSKAIEKAVYNSNKVAKLLYDLRDKFACDNHSFWNINGVDKNGALVKILEVDRKLIDKWIEVRTQIFGNGRPDDVKLRFIMRNKDRSKRYSLINGGISDEINLAKAATDYVVFFNGFLWQKEASRENIEEYDPIMYDYGLKMYMNVPIIEAAETAYKHSINTICFAIDTSGSCSGEIASGFLGELLSCIREIKSKVTEGEVLVMFCDCDIQEERVYEVGDIDEDEFVKCRLEGWGGTSFVPVFDRLRELENQGKKIDLLMYLTDGLGEYPQEKPDFPVCFVMDEESKALAQKWKPEWIEVKTIEKREE